MATSLPCKNILLYQPICLPSLIGFRKPSQITWKYAYSRACPCRVCDPDHRINTSWSAAQDHDFFFHVCPDSQTQLKALYKLDPAPYNSHDNTIPKSWKYSRHSTWYGSTKYLFKPLILKASYLQTWLNDTEFHYTSTKTTEKHHQTNIKHWDTSWDSGNF